MSYSHFSGTLRKIEQRRMARPWGVTLVVYFQVLKAAVLLFTGITLRLKPELVVNSESVLYPLLYVAMRGNSSVIDAVMQGGNVLPAIIVAWGLYLGTLGSGLWQMKGWARRSVVFTSGITLLLYAKAILLPSTPGLNSSSPDLLNVHLLLFFDAVIFFYLMRGNTADFFEARFS